MEKLDERIDEIIASSSSPIDAYSEIIELCHSELEQLKEKVKVSGFLNEYDEIIFFKKTKQIPLSNLIYYSELQQIELEVNPHNNPRTRKKILKRKLKSSLHVIQKHKEFNDYLRLGHTHFDKYYFVRNGKKHLPKQFINPSSADSFFDTSHDYLMGRLTAHTRLLSYLKREISQNTTSITNLEWTSSKSSLIELIYALHQTKAINGGSCDIKEISGSFENQFNINLGDVYGIFNEIKSRKSGRTKFLNQLTIDLLKKLDDGIS